MKNLTARQQEVLSLIVAFQKEHGIPPTQKEVADLMGASSPNAATDMLRALQRKGAVTLMPGVSRGISINSQSANDKAISLLRSLVNGEENARARAAAFLGMEV
ncbi:LexA family transcriptional regulator [Enterobacter sp. SA187]|uniref:LexA family protein n=1 Tax=Enterobacter sp. SA187 TaxID=1914861 RepID=UPI0009336FF6|nr:LexA family transcriptional regulator [Enterobacter sp. SA187]